MRSVLDATLLLQRTMDSCWPELQRVHGVCQSLMDLRQYSVARLLVHCCCGDVHFSSFFFAALRATILCIAFLVLLYS